MTINWKNSKGEFKKEVLENFEKNNGVKFPEKYVKIVKNFNGAYPDKNKFDLENEKEKVFYKLLNWDVNRKNNMIDFYKNHESHFDSKIIPFGEDPFGNLFCFNFKNENPSVLYWNHELNQFTKVAEKFESFLNMLY